jgi:hypothetical protein
MTLPGLVAAKNLADVADRERAWDNLGLNISANFVTDFDAATYIEAVNSADGNNLEPGVQLAINNFIVECKGSGIWPSINACCIMAGARTLAGCLIPLKGPIPTGTGFVSSDYNRRTGLRAGGGKFINTNYGGLLNLQDDNHFSVFVTDKGNNNNATRLISQGNAFSTSGMSQITYADASSLVTSSRRRSTNQAVNFSSVPSFVGASRSSLASYTVRVNNISENRTLLSEPQVSDSWRIFAGDGGALFSDSRISFYSIGNAVDLALLDNEVSKLMDAIFRIIT